MNKLNSKFFQSLLIALILLGVVSSARAAWTPPTTAPPGDAGGSVPLNTSVNSQTKAGNLTLGNWLALGSGNTVGLQAGDLSAGGVGLFNGLGLLSGGLRLGISKVNGVDADPPVAGSVLQSVDTLGNAAWVAGGSGVTWPLLAPLGSVNAPSYSFTGTPATGLWSGGGNTINFSSNGSNKLQVNSNGIGVLGNSSVAVGATSANASAVLDLISTTKGFLPPRMTTAQRDAIASPATGLVIFNTSTGQHEGRTASGWVALGSSGASSLWTASGNDIYNSNSGNVGIGTSNPSSKLHLFGPLRIGSGDSVSTRVDLHRVDSGSRTAALGYLAANNSLYLSNDEGGSILFRIGGTNYAAMQSGGANGVFTLFGTNPTALFQGSIPSLSLKTTQSGNREWRLAGGYVSASTFSLVDATAGQARMTVDSSGRVGIGMTPTTYALEVSGGAGKTDGSNVWSVVSDARFKNIVDYIPNALALVEKMKPIRYEWNELHDQKYGKEPGIKYGFTAQNVREVIPEFIKSDKEGYLWINSSGYEAVLTKAIQEQQKQIDELKQIVCADHPEAALCR